MLLLSTHWHTLFDRASFKRKIRAKIVGKESIFWEKAFDSALTAMGYRKFGYPTMRKILQGRNLSFRLAG